MSLTNLALLDLDNTLVNTQKLKDTYQDYQQIVTTVSHFTDSQFDPFLYDDAIPFINYLKDQVTPAIFSEGDIEFQRQKVALSSLKHLISTNHIFIYPPQTKHLHLEELARTHHLSFILDDQSQIIDFATDLHIPTIRLKRGEYRQELGSQQPTWQVESLQEIIDQDLLTKLTKPASS